MKQSAIYLDHNATTPVAPEAADAMDYYLREGYGNPSSGYALGKEAKKGVERARGETARLVGCKAEEIIFTSGGSESNNMVLKGLIDFRAPEKYHIITSPTEHPAILNPVQYLMEMGVRASIIHVDRFGRIDPQDIEKAVDSDTKLISVMLANNETGTLQPVKEIARIASAAGVAMHTDAAQAVGKIRVDVNELGVDFLSIAGHKIYGPKGVGALFVREGRKLTPLIHGAGQEMGMRAGTENVILAAGLGKACSLARMKLEKDLQYTGRLRDFLQKRLFENLDGLVLNGHPEERLPNTLNISFPGLEGDRVLEALPNIMASTGAACHDRTVRLSHVLSAMGISKETGMGAVRLTLGRSNTEDQIEEAALSIINVIKGMRHGKQ